MSPPPIFNTTPSNQMTINATMISQRIRPMYIPPIVMYSENTLQVECLNNSLGKGVSVGTKKCS